MAAAVGGSTGGEVSHDVAAELAAFEAELAPLLPVALRLATGMLMNGADAEDAVQEACLRAWDRRANRHADTELRPWFLAIVANRCRESRRSRWARLLPLPLHDSAVGLDVTDAATAGVDLRRAMRALPHRARLSLVSRYYLDLPHEDVAAVLGCSVDAAKATIRRATQQLQRGLER